MQDPVISATLTDVILEKLQTYITSYRTQKAKQDLKFTEKVYTEARDAYYKSQQAYAKFEEFQQKYHICQLPHGTGTPKKQK